MGFVQWMEERMAEKKDSLGAEDYGIMESTVAKYKSNLGHVNPVEYDEEEEDCLAAAEVVYLLNL